MRSNVGQSEQHASGRASNTLRAGRATRFGRDEYHTPLGGYTAPRSEGTSHSERDGQLCLMPVINNFRPGKKPLAFSV